MPKKIKNKKTRNEAQKDDCLTCLGRWTSCHEAVGWRTSHSPRVQRSQRPTAAAASLCWLTNCHGTTHTHLARAARFLWRTPGPFPSIVKQICLMFPLFRSSLQKTADARSSCVSFPYVLPHNKLFGLPGLSQNSFVFENEAYQRRGQNNI